MPEPVLTTTRLHLRSFIDSDAPRVHELLRDRRMSENNPVIPWPYELSTAIEWIAGQRAGTNDGSHLHFAVCLEDELVGATDLRIRAAQLRGWLGYWTGTDYWGQGIATEAAQVVINHGFARLGLTRIDAMHITSNLGSNAVMRKLGMHYISTTEAHVLKDWAFGDIEQFSLMASEQT